MDTLDLKSLIGQLTMINFIPFRITNVRIYPDDVNKAESDMSAVLILTNIETEMDNKAKYGYAHE